MDGTTAITELSINDDYHQGIFIDIFPLDLVPDEDDLRDQFIRQKVSKKEGKRHLLRKYKKSLIFRNELTTSFCGR